MAEIEVAQQNGHSDIHFNGGSEPKAVCHCCPYGYHIDLDFVRFCEKMAKANGEPSISKKLRRERRRQRQSMEVLLGLINPVIWNIEQLLPPIAQENSVQPVVAPIKYSSLYQSNDGLNKAVMDFEATLERTSKKKKQKIEDLGKIMNQRPVDFDGQIPAREESPSFRRYQDMSPYADFELMSAYSSGGGTSPSPLQNIREQMAISLKRMRELEEKVKIIPAMEVELYSLRNEKTELLEKLKHVKSELELTEYNLNEIKKSKKQETQTKTSPVELKPILRDVGVSCKVLTREVGIMPIVQKSRTIGTETVSETRITVNGHAKSELKTPLSKSIKSQIQPEIETRSTITDLYMKDISDILEKKSKSLSVKDTEIISLLPRSLDRLSKDSQTPTKETLTVLQVIEKKEVGIQVQPAMKQKRDAGFTVKPYVHDVSTEIRPKTRDWASSDDKITDLFCDKCKNLKTRDIGVGLGNVKLENKKSEVMINRSQSFQLTEKPKITTRNVAVGTAVPVMKLTSTKGVGTSDYLMTTTKNTGVNTLKLKLVDTAVGENKITELTMCEKCKNEIKISSAKSTVTTSHRDIGDGHSKEVQPSKIPRPKSNQTTPVMERKKFTRQDTYTKIPPQSPFEAAKKAKPKVKSSSEKNSSPLDEKTEVILRKKTIPASEQLPTPTEGSLSKDLKDTHISSNTERFSGHFDDYYFDYDDNYEDDSKRNSVQFPESVLFQPIQDEPREKIKPSKEMKAAMKVVNDSLTKYPNGLPKQLKNASNIIQQEWFREVEVAAKQHYFVDLILLLTTIPNLNLKISDPTYPHDTQYVLHSSQMMVHKTISSTASANPLDVEDYLDSFEEVSSTLLGYIVNMVDNNGNTAMHYAVSHGNFDVVSILLDSKVCNINKMNAAGYTCIMLVSLAQVRSETHRQVVKRLFQLADVNVRAKQHGQTALMLAVSHGRLDMVKLLLEAGADPNIQDGDGSTALMCAAEHGHLEIVKHIIAHPECDTSITDCDGSTALAIAMEAGNRDIGVLLYAREHFSSSRGSSPYTSLRLRKSKSSSSPHPKTPTSPNPNRKSDQSV